MFHHVKRKRESEREGDGWIKEDGTNLVLKT